MSGSMLVPDSAEKLQDIKLSLKPAEMTADYLSQGSGLSGMKDCSLDGTVWPMRKRRGRPRKYDVHGCTGSSLSPVVLSSVCSNRLPECSPPPGFGKKKQSEALGASGLAFTPHVIIVKAGEDVASKIMTFSRQASRTISILSGNGIISNVTLRQPAMAGGTLTYEGRFEIITLSGSFLLTEGGGAARSITGGLSVTLAGMDGRVLAGGVAGLLTAASTVQVVVGSFVMEVREPNPEPLKLELSSAPPQLRPQVTGFKATSKARPTSEGTSSESADDSDRPMKPISRLYHSEHNIHHSSFPPFNWSRSAILRRQDSDAKRLSD